MKILISDIKSAVRNGMEVPSGAPSTDKELKAHAIALLAERLADSLCGVLDACDRTIPIATCGDPDTNDWIKCPGCGANASEPCAPGCERFALLVELDRAHGILLGIGYPTYRDETAVSD